ncbi:MAG: TerB family tellurite resistance protein [Salinibacter sp.]
MNFTDEWTTAHDLALIYCGLACIDRDLTDDEIQAIKGPLSEWVPLTSDTTAEEVVQDAATALKHSQKEVGTAVSRVGQELGTDECREILRHLLSIAEADGVLLGAERELLHRLATAWNLKELPDTEGDGGSGTVPEDREDPWTLFHELAFLFVQMGCIPEDGPSTDTLGAMGTRLREWEPDRSGNEIREALRRAVRAFDDHADAPFIEASVETIEEALSPTQHLIVLEDLQAIGQADGPSTPEQTQRLQSLAEAWEMSTRFDEA